MLRGKMLFLSALTAMLLAGLLSCGQGPSFVETRTNPGVADGVEDPNNPDDPDNKSKDPASGEETPQPTPIDPAATTSPEPNTNPQATPTPGKEPKTTIIEKNYPADISMPSQVAANLDSPYLLQQFTLLRNYTTEKRSGLQVKRPMQTDTFSQGYRPTPVNEAFLQQENRLLDIVLVMDNSNSMKEEQQNLSQKLSPLLSYIAGTDWQIGVVTTDPDNGCIRSLIKKTDSNVASKFASAVQAGVNGDPVEKGVLQAVNSIKGTCLSSPWVRENSTLAVLFVSDEDNCSNGNECNKTAPYREGSYLYNYLASIRQPGKNARVYGLIWHPSMGQCGEAKNKANIYAQLIESTAGTWGPICQDDYTNTLMAVSQNIAAVLASKFTLKKVPNSGSAHVYVDGQEISSGYTLTGNVLEFAVPPADNSQINVVYEIDGKPIFSSFSLGYQPVVEAGFVVTINGQAQTSGYTYDSLHNQIIFTSAPSERSAVNVTYKRATPLATDFIIGTNVKPGSLIVKINGTETTDYSYLQVLGLIHFNTAPEEGATINFDYIGVGDPILEYPFSVNGQAPQGLVAYDTQTQAPIGVSYNQARLVVGSTYWVEGRQVTVRYINPARDRLVITLPHVPVVGSVKATDGKTTCQGAGKILVSGTEVTIQGCGFPDNVAAIQVLFDYVVETKMIFTFDGQLPENKTLLWQVFVNGKETTDYKRQDRIITFNTPLAIGSVVKVRVSYAE